MSVHVSTITCVLYILSLVRNSLDSSRASQLQLTKMAMPELTEDSQQSKRPHQEEKIFDFFGLPRELRDVIYDCLSVDVKPKLESSLEKTVNPVPFVNPARSANCFC